MQWKMKKANATGFFVRDIIIKQDHLNGICMDFLHRPPQTPPVEEAHPDLPGRKATNAQPLLKQNADSNSYDSYLSEVSGADGPSQREGSGMGRYVELQITTNFSFLR